jgi:hypothetical protein
MGVSFFVAAWPGLQGTPCVRQQGKKEEGAAKRRKTVDVRL